MVVKFVHCESEPFGPDDGSAAPAVPQPLLERHGARVLNPSEVTVAPKEPRPRSTAYRTGAMLFGWELLNDDRKFRDIKAFVNQKMGVDLVMPRNHKETRHCGRGPRPVGLQPVEGRSEALRVDAWQVLQALRASEHRGDSMQISVEHLMFGTVDIGGTPWEASGAPTGTTYVRNGTTGRIPVTYFGPPPARQELDRRPVIAVVDSGLGPNDWFGMPDRSTPPPPGGFLAVYPQLQDAIRAQEQQNQNATPTQLIRTFWDAPVTDNPLVGTLDRDTGHGTFIAGIIRQVAPDANVLAIRVLHSDGVAYEGDVLLALWGLVDRVERAQHGHPEDMVDVVSLSLGYFDENPDAEGYTGMISQAIDALRRLGVLVVAAAGNDATSRRFYPAALAERPENGAGPQVLSVGALNPSNTKALFSNEAPWVRCWATGAGIVSTFPKDVQGAISAGVSPRTDRGALDPDDFRAGFAVWDGTSFAAPLAAAEITTQMIKVAQDNPAIGLKVVDKDTATERVRAAIEQAQKASG
ncbi:S8/S53 family peptidase [Actinocrispum sp. NPDC049592]|uniref:S8 family peptidase n=1 Tax=Actinocrispum sp. NPDC049592 TaxID=3154835 RepID=UPI00344AE94D